MAERAPSTDNATANIGGTIYSGFGWNGTTTVSTLYAYDPSTGAWTQKASGKDVRDAPSYGAIDGKLYVVGGWSQQATVDSSMEVYDPSTDTWSAGVTAPAGYAGAASAVLGGKLYTVGGCVNTGCGTTDAWSFAPTTGSWQQIADYPEGTAWGACGPINGKLYCAGGENLGIASNHAYVYDPTTDSWSRVADVPATLWGTAYTSANGELLLQDGVADDALTNQGFAFDPASNSWSTLPETPLASYRFSGTLGFYGVGGSIGVGDAESTAQVLSGWDQSSDAAADWLSMSGGGKVTLAPGASATVTVAMDASQPSITQPGTYTAVLIPSTDTPYKVATVAVAMTVNPPKTWGKISGTVQYKDAAGNLHPLAGATVQITSWASSYTLHTDTSGNYQLWLDVRNNPLTLIVAKDGYAPQTATVKIAKGSTTVKDWTIVLG